MIKQFYFKQLNLESRLFALSLNVKQFYLTNREDPFRCYHSRPECVLQILQSSSIIGVSLSDCLESYPEHSLERGVLPHCRDAVGVFYSPSRLDKASLCMDLKATDHSAMLSNSQTYALQDWTGPKPQRSNQNIYVKCEGTVDYSNQMVQEVSLRSQEPQ